MTPTPRWLRRLAARLALDPVAPGARGDGLIPLHPLMRTAGSEFDRPWPDLQRELADTREIWRTNPLARRLVNLVTSFVVGDGFALSSDDPGLASFLDAFWNDGQNALALRQYTWCEELSRSGELFITLHLNPASGMSYVRTLPASSIDRIDFAPGSIVVIDRDNESWQAVAPNLHAADASADGRAIRWMIASGGPGVGLVDLGEADDANHATARAMGEQRSRFMRARQAYFAFVLAQVALTAYNRAVHLGFGPADQAGEVRAEAYARAIPATLSQVRVSVPDISPADNSELGAGAQQVAAALRALGGMGIRGDRWRSLALRLVLKFAGEAVDDRELAAILQESTRADAAV